MDRSSSVVRCDKILSHWIGVSIAFVSVLIAELLAYSHEHIGKNTNGHVCNHHYVVSISCGGVFMPEKGIWTPGLIVAMLFYMAAYYYSAQTLTMTMIPRVGPCDVKWGSWFLYLGTLGCLCFMMVAVVDLRMSSKVQHVFASVAFWSWILACVIRAHCPACPYPISTKVCTFLAKALLIVRLLSGNSALAWMEYAAVGIVGLVTLTFPMAPTGELLESVPETERLLMQKSADLEKTG